MSQGLLTASYLGSAILFILSLGGLSHPETARRGNLYGMLGMLLALLTTILGVSTLGSSTPSYAVILIPLLLGGTIGIIAAIKVKMTEMPELVALMHSLVGLAAVLVCLGSFLESDFQFRGLEQRIHRTEVFVGVLIGAVTFAGSLVAFGKLSGRITSQPWVVPSRRLFDGVLIFLVLLLGGLFLREAPGSLLGSVGNASWGAGHPGLVWVLLMMVLALIYGAHMVLAIGGADMPVVVSMLNSYSGWAASATGFMLSNDLLIVTGALVGSSGAILSYIMCKAMNRSFLSVIAGGFGGGGDPASAKKTARPGVGGEGSLVMGQAFAPSQKGEQISVTAEQVTEMLLQAKSVVVVPGYGMAVAQAQHAVQSIRSHLAQQGVKVSFAIHPVAGRMPGHMNVLLAEAKVPYDIVYEMDEINSEFSETDLVLIIGANDIVNPSALEDPVSPIAGMPVLEVWKAKTTVVMKRSLRSGYAGVDNPLFYRPNNRMLFGDAKAMLDEILTLVRSRD